MVVDAPAPGETATTRRYYQVAWRPTIIANGAYTAYQHMKYSGTLAKFYGYGTIASKHFSVVIWNTTNETAERCAEISGWESALAAHTKKLSEPPQPRPPPAPKDAALPNRERQGRWVEPNGTGAARKRTLTQNTHIDTQPCNPYLDTYPTGRFVIEMDETQPLAHVYGPDGRHIGTLSAETLRTLHTRHQHALHTIPQATAPHRTAGGFAEDVAKLLLRSKVDDKGKASKTAPTRERSLPGPLRQALMTALADMAPAHTSEGQPSPPPLVERFASPLNCSPLATAYFSQHAADIVFGATHDAFTQPFEGLSVAHPSHDPEFYTKALAWAVATTERLNSQNRLSVTLMTIPHNRSGSHTRLLTSPHVTPLAYLPPTSAAAQLLDGVGPVTHLSKKNANGPRPACYCNRRRHPATKPKEPTAPPEQPGEHGCQANPKWRPVAHQHPNTPTRPRQCPTAAPLQRPRQEPGPPRHQP